MFLYTMRIMNQSENLIESVMFESGTPGPRLLVLGAIHGDETCGPVAIQRVIEEIQSGELVLRSGTLQCVPISNPRAYGEGKRYVEDNLNRIFKKTADPKTYEARLANTLCALVDEADVLLDIHSSFAPAPVNLFVDYPTSDNLTLADALGAEFALYDWPKVYAESTLGFDSHTTDRYAYEAGKSGILIEAGQHTDPRSGTVAYEAILRTLVHLGMLEPRPGLTLAGPAKKVRMTKVFARESEGDVFASNWSHLESVPAGTLIAVRATGEELRTDVASVIIFPKLYAQPGGEWFYLGVQSED